MNRIELEDLDEDIDGFQLDTPKPQGTYFQRHPKRARNLCIGLIVTIIVFIILFFVGAYIEYNVYYQPANNTTTPEPTRTIPSYASGAVAADHPMCSNLGVGILKKGGNAVDAAVATTICQGVAAPSGSGIGGGAIILIRLANGKTIQINGREKAPAAASQNMFANESESQRGPKSIAVPGELAALWKAFSKYGSGNITWQEVIQPAIDLSYQGITVSQHLATILQSHKAAVLGNPILAKVFSRNGTLLTAGQNFTRPFLADTLDRIALGGIDIFYTGLMGVQLAQEIQSMGGLITAQDFANYTAEETEAITTTYHNFTVSGASPPISGGPCTHLALNILETLNISTLYSSNPALAVHYMIEALKFSYSDRMALGDPAYVANVNNIVATMLNKTHAAALRNRISANQTFDPDYYVDLTEEILPLENHGTTSLSVVDKFRNAVVITSTVNLDFGSMVVSPSTGIIMNDEMDDFSSPNLTNAYNYPPSTPNFIVGGKRPLSSMTPTIISRNGKLVMAVGGSGGSRIISAVFQVMLNVIDLNLDVELAVMNPRFHTQLIPDLLYFETAYPYPPAIVAQLARMGHVNVTWPYGAAVQAVTVQNNLVYAKSDPRKYGQAAGY
eukprot:TRINITY_DN2450_c3_g1_i1.p1 TRINITY_DN2450_c3_g1~~TRINITY_DN2450_c3_g1_i1.p1  ORF type:complete len:617 (+),score=197.12 TRINITY_DN2450_c3_g1_i1:94-1944(+)